jgi:hypothetical protein
MQSLVEPLQLQSGDSRELNRRIGIVTLWRRRWRGIAELLLMFCLLLLVQLYLLLLPLLAVMLHDLQFQAAAGVPERVQALEVRGEVQEAALWQETERWVEHPPRRNDGACGGTLSDPAAEGTWESGN